MTKGSWHGGKGSSQRRSTVDRAKYEENYHRIFGYKDKKADKCLECGEVDGRHTYKCIYFDRD